MSSEPLPLSPESGVNVCCSVDDITDRLIQKIIRRKFARHTIIAVAHKLETILDFDRVAVLDNGSMREFDDPHTLLSRPSSAFRQLYNSSVHEGLDMIADTNSEDTNL